MMQRNVFILVFISSASICDSFSQRSLSISIEKNLMISRTYFDEKLDRKFEWDIEYKVNKPREFLMNGTYTLSVGYHFSSKYALEVWARRVVTGQRSLVAYVYGGGVTEIYGGYQNRIMYNAVELGVGLTAVILERENRNISSSFKPSYQIYLVGQRAVIVFDKRYSGWATWIEVKTFPNSSNDSVFEGVIESIKTKSTRLGAYFGMKLEYHTIWPFLSLYTSIDIGGSSPFLGEIGADNLRPDGWIFKTNLNVGASFNF